MPGRDRRAATLARAWCVRRCWQRPTIRDVASLIRSVRRECARVADIEPHVLPDVHPRESYMDGRHDAAASIRALDRAPKKRERKSGLEK